MKEEERKLKIDKILSFIKDNPTVCEGLSPTMWIIALSDPTNAEWLRFCQQAVDWHYQEYGKKDTESIFAQCIRLAKNR